jgi:hypothetical protein
VPSCGRCPRARCRVEILLPSTARITLVEREAVGRWIASDNVEWFIDARRGAVPVDRSDRRARAAGLRRARPRSAGQLIDPPALVEAALRLAALASGELRSDATDLKVVMTAGRERPRAPHRREVGDPIRERRSL